MGVSTTLANHHKINPFKKDYFFHPNMFGTFSKEDSMSPTFKVNQARSTHILELKFRREDDINYNICFPSQIVHIIPDKIFYMSTTKKIEDVGAWNG